MKKKYVTIAVDVWNDREVKYYNTFIPMLNRYVITTKDIRTKGNVWLMACTIFQNNLATRLFTTIFDVIFRQNCPYITLDLGIEDSN